MKKGESSDQQHKPLFSNEQEEAAWWDAHPEILTQQFQKAKQEGRLLRLSQTDLPGASETVTVRIPNEEVTRARHLAAKRGLSYQDYLKMLLHNALNEEEKRIAG